jgi:hypothetical protein
MNSISRSILARSLMTCAASLAFVAMVPATARAEIVIVEGADGFNGPDGVGPNDPGLPGGDGEPVSAESFFRGNVIDLGSSFGPEIDLTFGYNLVADGSGAFGFDFAVGGAVPEPSTWAMILLGFASLGCAGYRRVREPSAA